MGIEFVWRKGPFNGSFGGICCRLALVADRAVLGFVIFHRDFEHVVASNTYAMDFRGRFFAGLGFCSMRGVLIMLWLAHGRILA
jgi:hypothetical protein